MPLSRRYLIPLHPILSPSESYVFFLSFPAFPTLQNCFSAAEAPPRRHPFPQDFFLPFKHFIPVPFLGVIVALFAGNISNRRSTHPTALRPQRWMSASMPLPFSFSAARGIRKWYPEHTVTKFDQTHVSLPLVQRQGPFPPPSPFTDYFRSPSKIYQEPLLMVSGLSPGHSDLFLQPFRTGSFKEELITNFPKAFSIPFTDVVMSFPLPRTTEDSPPSFGTPNFPLMSWFHLPTTLYRRQLVPPPLPVTYG